MITYIDWENDFRFLPLGKQVMSENLDFCRKCEASFTHIDGNEFGLCPTCENESLAMVDELDRLDDEARGGLLSILPKKE